MTKQKVYVVTSGTYSEYRIDAVFSTKELAEKFIDTFREIVCHRMGVEEWDLDTNETHLKKNRKPYFIQINRRGDVSYSSISDIVSDFEVDLSEPEISYTDNNEWMNVNCFADDESHAIKIANEKRLQILAANIWGVT